MGGSRIWMLFHLCNFLVMHVCVHCIVFWYIFAPLDCANRVTTWSLCHAMLWYVMRGNAIKLLLLNSLCVLGCYYRCCCCQRARVCVCALATSIFLWITEPKKKISFEIEECLVRTRKTNTEQLLAKNEQRSIGQMTLHFKWFENLSGARHTRTHTCAYAVHNQAIEQSIEPSKHQTATIHCRRQKW